MSNGGGGDGWADVRNAVITGLFLLGGGLLWMIHDNPNLLNNTSFMVLATLIFGGSGLGAVVAFLFGGTKTGSEVMKSNAETLQASTPPASPIHVEVTPAEPPA